MRPDSSLGVAGLVHAVRAGNVTIANALGSGLVEMPALLAFLPALCRALLGEDLRLPNVPTYWCGDEKSRGYVLDHLAELVVKSAMPGPVEPVFGGDLSSSELYALKQKILARPFAYIGQERLPLSMAPAMTEDGVQPRHLSLRTFLARRDDGYLAMPGGLTRVANSKDSPVVTIQRGGGSKDAWVLARGEPGNFTLLPPPDRRVEVVRSGGDLPSRVADNMFWIGRYVERAEGTTRLMRSLITRRVDDSAGRAPEIRALLTALEDDLELIRGALVRPAPGVESELVRLLVSAEPSRTPGAGIEAGHRAARVVRDRISMDTWRVLSQLAATIAQARARAFSEPSDALETVASLLLGFSAFSGLVMENMTHGPGWRFADIGRRIERGGFMVRLLRSTLVAADDTTVLDAVLEVADSAMTYRSRYLGTMALEPVLDLLLTDETNPRSVVYQLAMLEEHVKRLPRASERPLLAAEAKTVLRALSQVRCADIHLLAHADSAGKRVALDELLQELERALPLLAEQLTLSYLAHAQASYSLGGPAERA
ncbi:MAG: circularly permuted type 2 ATP-grasp protein [Polyangiaceae bacterium]